MKNSMLAVTLLMVSLFTARAQNAVLYESNNIVVKSLYSSLVAGEETAVFYEVTGKDPGEIIPKIILNGELIDSLQSPISIAATKGPYVCLVFVFRKDKKATAVETVWIPVTDDHRTKFILTDQGRFFEKEGEVRVNANLMIEPIIGTTTRQCTYLNILDAEISLVRSGQIKMTTRFNGYGIDMRPIRLQAYSNDQIVIKINRLSCLKSDYTDITIDIPLADRYIKAKLTDVNTMPTFSIDDR